MESASESCIEENAAERYNVEDAEERNRQEDILNLNGLDEATISLRWLEFSLYENPSPTPYLTIDNLSRKFGTCREYPTLAARMEQARSIHQSPPYHTVPDSSDNEENLPEVDQLSSSSSEPELIIEDMTNCGWELTECLSQEYNDISSATSESDYPGLLTDKSDHDSDSGVKRSELYYDIQRVIAKLQRDEEKREREREEMGSPPSKRTKCNLESEHSRSVTSAYTGWSPPYSSSTVAKDQGPHDEH